MHEDGTAWMGKGCMLLFLGVKLPHLTQTHVRHCRVVARKAAMIGSHFSPGDSAPAPAPRQLNLIDRTLSHVTSVLKIDGTDQTSDYQKGGKSSGFSSQCLSHGCRGYQSPSSRQHPEHHFKLRGSCSFCAQPCLASTSLPSLMARQ